MIIWLDFYGLRELLAAFNQQSRGAICRTKYLHCFVVVFLSKCLVALSFQSISHDDFGIK